MIDITVKKDDERVAVVRFFGWGIFNRFGKARLTEAEKLAEDQGRAYIPEDNGFEAGARSKRFGTLELSRLTGPTG
jgi:hypothetical protein